METQRHRLQRFIFKVQHCWAVVVAQLVEGLLPPPEIRGSNPNIGKVLSTKCELNRKDNNKEKEKEARKGPSLKKYIKSTTLLLHVYSSLDYTLI